MKSGKHIRAAYKGFTLSEKSIHRPNKTFDPGWEAYTESV